MASAGKVIDGRFQLLDRLGSGGMGTVWRARDLMLDREVALKEVRPAGPEPQDDSGRARELRERVLREARALARLDHPNVVTVHHIVDSPGTAHPWIVMELVRGRSLQDRLDQGPLAPAEAAAVGRGILAALRAAHAAGICHRDVKPANVLLREDGSPVLTDFGIAALRESTRVTVTGGLVGSPQYIAPERLHGQEGDPASDLWSLGMLLYVSVEGHHPMRRSSAAATLAAVMSGVVPPPRQAGPLALVLQALLVPDPAARPTAEQLDSMLAQAAGQLPAPAAPSTPAANPMPVMNSMPYTGPAHYPPYTTPTPYTNPVPLTNPVPVPATAHGMPYRHGRRSGAAVAAIVLAAAALVAVPAAAVLVLPEVLGDRGGNTAYDATRTTAPAARDAAGGTRAGADSTRAASLLSPDRIRSVISELEKTTGGAEFTRFTVYDQYAVAEAPVQGRGNLYDRFTYRDGRATRTGAGGTLDPDDARVKLSSFNWDAVPGLLRTAERTLGVAEPTNRYLFVDPAWAFANDQPVVLVYLTDDYGGAYLAADMRGRVLRSYPRRN